MSVSTTVTVVLRSVVTALNEGAPCADRLPIATQSGQLGIADQVKQAMLKMQEV